MPVLNHEMPRMTVSAAGSPLGGGGLRALFADGSALISIGGLVAGGFAVEAAKSFMTNEPKGRIWFVLAFAAGVTVILVGFWQRAWRRRRLQVGIVITAADNLAAARQREQQAEAFSSQECVLTLKAAVDLPIDQLQRLVLMEALVEETLQAIITAQRLTPDAARINLIPTMRLQIAFWYGARLGHTHSREIAVYSVRQGNGNPAYFHATGLRASRNRKQILTVAPLETVPGGDPSRVALALDLQGRGTGFHDQVLNDCRNRGIGTLLLLSHTNPTLPETKKAFTAVTDQICQVWRDSTLPVGGRTSQHTIYLSGPVAISVALGARLAAADRNRWTALSYNTVTSAYEPFPS
ncbi:SAVED domain-containing protein [Nocardia mikamii]|uniref:SAVED domain-containing protein n=1 Tax=Nocardia mikamii TaxID=508464 RepID=UPI001C3FE9B4|nr:SAVED domain-containing protein [Nocardia mikamii]